MKTRMAAGELPADAQAPPTARARPVLPTTRRDRHGAAHHSWKRPGGARPVAALALSLLGLLLAACSSSGSGSGQGAHHADAGGASSVSGATVTITTADGSAGTYLTDSAGRALYLWVADSPGKSTCSDACARAWPPLVSTGAPATANGVDAADIGTATRPDGSKQISYDGHPLYYFAGDTGPGQTTGQGSDGFGAKWWLVATSGAAITTSSGAASTPTIDTSGGYGYGRLLAP